MVNLVDLLETEDTSITNPGNYYGPEVSPFGVVIDNGDEETHTPETEEERRKRMKKKKNQMDPNMGPTGVSSREDVDESKVDKIDSLLSDPEVQSLLARLLKKSLSSPVGPVRDGEVYEGAVQIMSYALLEAEGSIGPISKEEEKELESFPEEEVKKGIAVEKEHTDSGEVAKNIVRDHLKEMRKKGKKPNYYELLNKYVEGDSKKS